MLSSICKGYGLGDAMSTVVHELRHAAQCSHKLSGNINLSSKDDKYPELEDAYNDLRRGFSGDREFYAAIKDLSEKRELRIY